eukprot:13344994-Ditylum_brightwellii.AAC.1
MAVAVDGEGNHDKAVELLQGCWEDMKKKLGEMHPYSLECLYDLASALKNQGNHSKAEKLQRDC